MGTEFAPWAGQFAIEEENPLGTEATQRLSIPLTAVPTAWPVGPDPLPVEPVLDALAWPTDNFTILGRKGGIVPGFETFITASTVQWVTAGLNGVAGSQGIETSLVQSLEWTDSTPATFNSFTGVLELGETELTTRSRMIKGCIVPRMSLSWAGNELGKLNWDYLYRDCGEPTGVPGGYTSMYHSADTAKCGRDFTTTTWGGHTLNIIKINFEYTNGITLDNLEWTDAQTWDAAMLQIPTITGSCTIGWDHAADTLTIDDDATARTAKPLVLTSGAGNTDGQVSISFPARIIGDLDIKPENGMWTCMFNFEGIDDETTPFSITTCAHESTKFVAVVA